MNIINCKKQQIAAISQEKYSNENMVRQYLREYDQGGKKKRILLIDVNCKHSSTGKIVYDLYQGIMAEGRSAAICYGRGEIIKEKQVFKFGIDAETVIHAALARITGYNGYFSPLSTIRLMNFIKKYKPDLIHIHELHAYFVNIKTLINFIKKEEIPLVWTFHCEYMYTGKCGHAYDCTKFKNECGNCPAVKEYPSSLYFDKTKQMLKMKKKLLGNLEMTIITPSQWLANRVKQSFLKNKEVRVIYNGVDINIFHYKPIYNLRKNLKISEEYKIVLFVAPDVTSVRKGAKWVMQLSNLVSDMKIVFLMVGGGEIPQIHPKNVLYVGKVQDENVLAEYYSMADVFLLCSEKETYSMTCAEALCCGTPVLGFKCGAPETVFKGENAKFVDYGDIDALEKELRGMLFKK